MTGDFVATTEKARIIESFTPHLLILALLCVASPVTFIARGYMQNIRKVLRRHKTIRFRINPELVACQGASWLH